MSKETNGDTSIVSLKTRLDLRKVSSSTKCEAVRSTHSHLEYLKNFAGVSVLTADAKDVLVRLHLTQGVCNVSSTAISDAQGKHSRKSFFRRLVGASTAF